MLHRCPHPLACLSYSLSDDPSSPCLSTCYRYSQAPPITVQTIPPPYACTPSPCQSRIGPLDAHVEALQVQIINLETTLAQFDPGGKRLELVRQHQSIVSPVRCMPAEVICDILALTWETQQVDRPGISGTSADFGDALSYPNLWSSRHSNPPRIFIGRLGVSRSPLTGFGFPSLPPLAQPALPRSSAGSGLYAPLAAPWQRNVDVSIKMDI
ncbi:hypothetical protein B0H14DRAFT_441993 [Mycena olivaceomarginata]|nr:hypothetical protein B0H14DRAFT_441993 [Mycena olivaceomarginata]